MKDYCIRCGKIVDYYTTERATTAIIRGTTVSYTSRLAFCSECNTELYMPNISDENIKCKMNAYWEQSSIITIDEINAIMKIYLIGTQELSLLLGFKNDTIAYFCKGGIPSVKSSNILKSVLHSPEVMRKYVNNNQNEALKPVCKEILTAIDD